MELIELNHLKKLNKIERGEKCGFINEKVWLKWEALENKVGKLRRTEKHGLT